MQTVWVFFSQEVEEQSHSNQEILRLTYIHPKTCHDENVIQNLRQKEGVRRRRRGRGGEDGGRGRRGEGGEGRKFLGRSYFKKIFFWQVMNNGVDDRKKGL